MAALYLHNAIFSPEPVELPPSHSRTISTATLRTIASDHSHPTEPLLDPLYSGSAYLDLLERQPAHPRGPSPGWDMGLSLDDIPTLGERRGYWEKAVRRRLKVLKLTVLVFEMVMGGSQMPSCDVLLMRSIGAWAVYNTVRYFLAFAVYQSITGQDVSLALGTSTAVSATFLLCRVIVSFFQTQLIRAHVHLHSILLTRTIFRFLASIFLLGPAIVAFALTFVWRSVPEEPELNLSQRCGLDLDVVWVVSSSSTMCQGRAHHWASWLGLSILRIFITLAIIASHSHSRRIRVLIITLSRFLTTCLLLPIRLLAAPPKEPADAGAAATASLTPNQSISRCLPLPLWLPPFIPRPPLGLPIHTYALLLPLHPHRECRSPYEAHEITRQEAFLSLIPHHRKKTHPPRKPTMPIIHLSLAAKNLVHQVQVPPPKLRLLPFLQFWTVTVIFTTLSTNSVHSYPKSAERPMKV